MTRTPRRYITALVAALLAAIAVAAIATSTTSAKAKSPTLKLRNTNLGKILVDKSGRTLYAFGHDKKNKSRCSGQCAANWPPAAAPAKPTVA